MAEVTHRRLGELLRGVLEVLRDAGEPLPVGEVLARVEARVPPTPFEQTTYPSRTHVRRYPEIVKWSTVSPVKAGWLRKIRRGNRSYWAIEQAGIEALQTYHEPVELIQVAGHGYRAWKAANPKAWGNGRKPEPADTGLKAMAMVEAEVRSSAPTDPTPISTVSQGALSASLFKNVTYSVANLVSSIRHGTLGLPDIQRPFLWEDRKVRDLLDSMYKGFPVGALLLWEVVEPSAATIGTDSKQKAPTLLIVDGQQRLTSLYAVRTGAKVRRKDFSEDTIQIAFRPADQRFEVCSAVIKGDPEWIPDISALWDDGTSQHPFITEFLARQREFRVMTGEEENALSNAIVRLYQLDNYQFTALELAPELDEEFVADIFVRINSQGKKLTGADFILTLMSVYWEEGRRQLEGFAAAARTPSTSIPSPFNHLIVPDPEDLLRVSVAVAFRRANLAKTYSLLRGKDLSTDKWSSERRTEQFDRLGKAQAQVLDLTNWHEYLKAIQQAGFRRQREIVSRAALLNGYALFLIGRIDFGVDVMRLRTCVARWFFMAQMTSRYTTASESTLEQDLAQFRLVDSADEFVALIERIIDETLTSDYWATRLPRALETTSPASAGWAAYAAALVLLDAPVLFSDLKVETLFAPSLKAKKNATEKHHLFPRGWLAKQGMSNKQDDQVANFAFVEWPVNIKISDSPPATYWAQIAPAQLGAEPLKTMRLHALPQDWVSLEYEEFLEQRRVLMADVIREGFSRLGSSTETLIGTGKHPQPTTAVVSLTTPALIANGENDGVEFKESARWSLKPPVKDQFGQERPVKTEREGRLSEFAVAKSVAGFLNAVGGTLLIGVKDGGEVCGIEPDLESMPDGKQTPDGYQNWLINDVFRVAFGGRLALQWVRVGFESFGGVTVCRVDVQAAQRATYVRGDRFFVRNGSTTQEYTMPDAVEYIRLRGL